MDRLAGQKGEGADRLLIVAAGLGGTVSGDIAQGQGLLGRPRQAHLEDGLALTGVALDNLGVTDQEREFGAGAVVVQDYALGLQAHRVAGEGRPRDIAQLQDQVFIGLRHIAARGGHQDHRTGLTRSDRQRANVPAKVDASGSSRADSSVVDRDVGAGRLGQADDEDEVSGETAVGLDDLGAGDREHRHQTGARVVVEDRGGSRGAEDAVGNRGGGRDGEREALRALDQAIADDRHAHFLHQRAAGAEAERAGGRDIVDAGQRRAVAGGEVQRQIRAWVARQSHQEDRLALTRVAFDDAQVIDQQRELVAGAVVVQDRAQRPQADLAVGELGATRVGQFEHEGFVGLDLATPERRHRDRRAGLAGGDRQCADFASVVDPLDGRHADGAVVDLHRRRRRLRQRQLEHQIAGERTVRLHYRDVRDSQNWIGHYFLLRSIQSLARRDGHGELGGAMHTPWGYSFRSDDNDSRVSDVHGHFSSSIQITAAVGPYLYARLGSTGLA